MEPQLSKPQANLMAATWTRAAKVRRAFKAGRQRQKDLLLTPVRAILEGSIVLHELQIAMEAVGLPQDDVKAGLVLMSESGFYAVRIPPTSELPGTFDTVRALEGAWQPLGLVLCQLDREVPPESGSAIWLQPWLVGPEPNKCLIAAAKEIANGKYGLHQMN